MTEMLNKKQIIAKRLLTILYGLGVGILIGGLPYIILWEIFFCYSCHLQEFVESTIDEGWIMWLFFSFFSTIGAYIGKIWRKSNKAFWRGAIIALVVILSVLLCGCFWMLWKSV